jgi:DNA-binding SARP family transcriptional activator
MQSLRVHLLGGLELHRGSAPLPPFPTRRAAALFAFLALHAGRSFHREALAGLFWGDHPEERARKCLRTTLWRVRRVVEGGCAPGSWVRAQGGRVGLGLSGSMEVDVHAFLEGIARAEDAASTGKGPDDRAVVELEGALALYRGDLLEEFYEDWAAVERERVRLMRLRGLEILLQWRRDRREWAEAARRAREILMLDPLREHVHRALMATLNAMGDRPSAIRQFHLCRRLLDEELEVGPMPETAALHRTILEGGADGGDRSGAPGASGGMVAEVDGLLEQLYAVAGRLERARAALESAGVRASRG